MATFKAFKVVGDLPAVLEANAIYAVRVGVGFDLYISDSTGETAHRVNQDPAEYPIFETAAEADAYTLANPGKVAFARNAP